MFLTVFWRVRLGVWFSVGGSGVYLIKYLQKQQPFLLLIPNSKLRHVLKIFLYTERVGEGLKIEGNR